MKVSILLPAFRRANLLRLGLLSILKYKPTCDYEILVLNDGIIDQTEEVCKMFEGLLNIKYIFTGNRNLDGVIKKRVPGFALNIGIKQSEGDIIILSCPEMYHLNNAIDIIVNTVIQNKKGLVIPEFVYFDQARLVTNHLLIRTNEDIIRCKDPELIDSSKLISGDYGHGHVVMPFLLGLYKKELLDINGYDEDFIGYAAEDNDLIDRLKLNGCNHIRTLARAIHLYHEGSTDGRCHWENPDWVLNFNLYQSRKGIIKRNEGRLWGML